MNLYQSNFLTISKQGDTMVQSWSDINLDVDTFKLELNNFKKLFEKVKPKNLVFDTKNCNLNIPEELNPWIGENILLPIFKKGIKNIFFTIPENIAVHFSILKSLEKAKAIIQPTYFSDLNEAIFHIKNKKNFPQTLKLPQFIAI